MSKITPRFAARNANGQLNVTDGEGFSNHLKSLPDLVYLTVRDVKELRQRSSSQNGYYWSVVVKMFSDETGYDKYEAHELLKSLLLSEKATIATKDGEKIIDVTRSTKSLTTSEMEEYLANIRVWCAINVGISIPEPQEVE